MKKTNAKMRDKIIIHGARVNNLRNIDVEIPRDKFVVITGLSGSGKSSLAFDTVYEEGNRRYVEGLSSYARNFLDVSAKPEVDKIENLSPTISIDQRSISRSPRSTVGTLTEIYDYLRVFYAKLGKPFCPDCGMMMRKKSKKEILEKIKKFSENTQVAILAQPAEIYRKSSSAKEILRHIQQLGYARVYLNGKIMTTADAILSVGEENISGIAAVIDRITNNKKKSDDERILDSIETAMKIGRGSIILFIDNQKEEHFNQDFTCEKCGAKIKEINPCHFSFNSPEGACSACFGLGVILRINPNLIIPNKNLSILEGAIKPLSKAEGKINNHNGYLPILKTLAEKYGFSLADPVKKMAKEHLNIILYGTGTKQINQTINDGGELGRAMIFFEGIVPMLEKKYQETKSDYMRSEIERYMFSKVCPACGGKRLKKEYLAVLVNKKSINDLVVMNISALKNFFLNFSLKEINENEKNIFDSLSIEIIRRLTALENVGLEYLNLARGAQTISGGEAQRVRLAVQLNSQLMSIIYVLDEPSIGLHKRDNEKLIATIKSLRDEGSSLIVVEHDEDIIKAADWIIDMGPGAGEDGGKVIFSGNCKSLLKSKTLTADYLLGRKKVSLKNKFRKGNGKSIEIIKANENNLKNINVKFPLGKFIAVCGVSGSGKSTLVNDILAKALSRHFFSAKAEPGKHQKIKGLGHINKVINMDQSPIGRTPRSNAATYTGIFSHIREIFAQQEEAKNRNYTTSQFSFNMKGGRCEVCQGEGSKKIEMHLLPDMYVRCEACEGTRYSRKTLEVEYKGYNIAEVLEMDVNFASNFFIKYQLIAEKLNTMKEVGLGYLKLGQSANKLSGGEAQRIKLAAELARKSTGKTLYILDEPTIGLHFEDISKLLKVLDALVDKGNSILVVEHNLDVIKNADWVIELGPDGGQKGGEIIYEGAPDKIKKCKKSWTGKYL